MGIMEGLGWEGGQLSSGVIKGLCLGYHCCSVPLQPVMSVTTVVKINSSRFTKCIKCILFFLWFCLNLFSIVPE